ncbi:MAG: hypothetical protein CMO55_04125 [Verrucomicrobiales bacterium]|nr:hypothetical protein [Verrucomicrobiales bacterium]
MQTIEETELEKELEIPEGEADRTEYFARLAEKRASGQFALSPLNLSDEQRRLYVRETLREDHQFRILNRPEGAQAKFDKLANSVFKFFRGTALLYYRDYAGDDVGLPVVFSIGDIHPENFGVMPNESRAPIFGVNDFDEAYYAPFSWDVKRGSVGFWLAAKENGFKKKKRKKIVKKFVKGYLKGLREFSRNDREKWHQMRMDNSPKMIRKLLKSAMTDREDFLEEYVDLDKARFRPTDEIVPLTSDLEKFQDVMRRYEDENDIPERDHNGGIKVKDVAIKKDSGTASLGLDRYFVLIEGPSKDPTDDIILELKQSRRSALHGLVQGEPGYHDDDHEAGRIARSHAIHLCGGDPYYGKTEIDGKSFLVRERSPYKEGVDLDDLDFKHFKKYASICGLSLAVAHARSDQDEEDMDEEAENLILESIIPDVFVDDVIRFTKVAAKRIKRDYEAFVDDHELGAFQFL